MMDDKIFYEMRKDTKYNNMQKKKQNLKNKIYDNAISSKNKIPYIKRAIKLSDEICEYALKSGYSKAYMDSFKNDPNKYDLDNFKDLLTFYSYYQYYEKALDYEKNENYDKALKLYMDILENYVPTGSSYYENPISLLEKKFEFEDAIKICDLAIDNVKKYNLNFETSTFENWKDRLIDEIKLSKELPPYIKNNPGILQQDVYKNFDLEYKDMIRSLLYYMDKNNTITRKKHGRSYELYME